MTRVGEGKGGTSVGVAVAGEPAGGVTVITLSAPRGVADARISSLLVGVVDVITDKGEIHADNRASNSPTINNLIVFISDETHGS